MISTLTCSLVWDAKRSGNQLSSLVGELVASNRNMSERLERMEMRSIEVASTTTRAQNALMQEDATEDNESFTTVRGVIARPSLTKGIELKPANWK